MGANVARANRQRYRIVAETASDAIITIDRESTIVFVNPAVEKIFGYGAEELLGSNLTMLMPDYLRRMHNAGMQRYLETGRKHISWEGVELPGLHKRGHEIQLEISFGEFTEDGNHFYTGIARDITARKRTERRLAVQLAITRILAEATTLDSATLKILQVTCESLGWEMGAFWRVDEEANELRCVQIWNAPEVKAAEFQALSRERGLSRGTGMPGLVWSTREPFWSADVTLEKTFPRAAVAAQEGLRGAFCFPIMLGEEVLGVVEFFSRESRQPDAELLEVMSGIGSQIGQFIERKQAEEERTGLQEKIIRMQESLLAELSTPLIPISREIVIMPLIGTMNEGRAEQMLNTLLRGVTKSGTRVAILDITGVPSVDSQVANMLMHAAQAVRLLGSEVVLTGIRPQVAQTLIGLGLDLGNITTRRNLQSGIDYAVKLSRPQT